MSDGVEIFDRTVAFQGFFRVDRFRLRHRLFKGGWSAALTREVFERGCTVGVLLYDPDQDSVVLVEQFRLPAHLAGFPGWQVEIVAGILDHPGESETAVALREVEEEAGLAVLGEILPIHRVMTTPGGSTEVIDLFCGRVDARQAGGIHGLAEEHEDIKVVVLSYRAAMKRLRADGFQNGPTVLALLWLMANRRMLRRRWRAAP